MAAKKTSPHTVVTDGFRFDGEDVAVGEVVELTEDQAKQLIELGAVEPVAAPAETKSKK